MSFNELLNSNKIKRIIVGLDVTSFVLANLIIFLIINYFYNFSLFGWKSILVLFIYFFVGLGISFVFLKTETLIDIGKKEKQTQSNNKIIDIEINDKNQQEYIQKKLSIGIFNLFLILFRLLFFNILKELFLIIIVWLSFLTSIFYMTNFISLENTYAFTNFVSVVTVLGVISGIFQFYISSYKQQISQKVLNSLTKYFIKIMNKVSYQNFLDYLCENHKDIYNDVADFKQENKILQLLAKRHLPGKQINVFNFSFYKNEFILEHINTNSKAKTKLKKFFEIKNEEIKKELDLISVKELRKVLLPNIIFFNDIILELIKTQFEFDFDEYDNPNPETYEDFLKNFVAENVFYFIDRILYEKELTQ